MVSVSGSGSCSSSSSSSCSAGGSMSSGGSVSRSVNSVSGRGSCFRLTITCSSPFSVIGGPKESLLPCEALY